MNINMEIYNSENHDSQKVATLIYLADEEFNEIVFGPQEEGVEAIKKIMAMDYNYFTAPHLHCAVCEGEIVGVFSGFTGREKETVEQASGKSFARAFGFWNLLKRMPIYLRMGNMSWKSIDDDGYLVNSLCVDPAWRGKGTGSQMLDHISSNFKKVYLDVNIHNIAGQQFYERLGFKEKAKNTMRYKGKTVGLISLLKDTDSD